MTLNELKLKMFYDPMDGLFFRLPGHEPVKMSPRGGRKGKYYDACYLDGVTYYAHHLAWFYMTGEWPSQIDHRDTVRTHNWWNNLRPATNAQNQHNASTRSDNTSGTKGVAFHKPTGLWRAIVNIGKGKAVVRYSRSKEEAVELRQQLAREHFGDYARD